MGSYLKLPNISASKTQNLSHRGPPRPWVQFFWSEVLVSGQTLNSNLFVITGTHHFDARFPTVFCLASSNMATLQAVKLCILFHSFHLSGASIWQNKLSKAGQGRDMVLFVLCGSFFRPIVDILSPLSIQVFSLMFMLIPCSPFPMKKHMTKFLQLEGTVLQLVLFFSEEVFICKFFGILWRSSLSFRLCVCCLDINLKDQIVFQLISLRHNPTLSRCGCLHLCLLTIK